MTILSQREIDEFNNLVFWIKVDLRDFEFNEETVSDQKDLMKIMKIMETKYKGHYIVDKDIVYEMIHFPNQVSGCKYNIIDKMNEIENIAFEFRNARSKILDDTWDFVNEKEEMILAFIPKIQCGYYVKCVNFVLKYKMNDAHWKQKCIGSFLDSKIICWCIIYIGKIDKGVKSTFCHPFGYGLLCCVATPAVLFHFAID